MEVYTKGVFVTSARFHFWSVRIDQTLYASHSIKVLQKRLSHPDAKVGCYVEIRYMIQTKINSAKRIKLFGHIDFNTGEFTESDKSDPSEPGKYGIIEPTQLPEEIIKVVVDQMVQGWKAKFQREAAL